jgi:hypothetical protein
MGVAKIEGHLSEKLTCNSSISDSEQLGFVVSSDGWIGVGVSWKEWKLVWHVIGLHFLALLYFLVLTLEGSLFVFI